MYPRRPKAEAFSNAIDVVERLRIPTDPSTKRTSPPRSAQVQLGDVPRTLDPVEAEGEFRQHDGVVPMMIVWLSGHPLVRNSLSDLQGYEDTLSLSLLCITMILRDRRIFFEILRSPTVASEPGLCLDVICMSRTQRVVGDNTHTAYQHVIL